MPFAEPSPRGPFYLAGLDGIRSVAFLMVFAVHAIPADFHRPWIDAALHAGPYGVPVFFVLSAFLITRLLLLERERTGRVDLRAFYVRRALRIWPLYFLLVIGSGVAALASGTGDWRSYACASTFTLNWWVQSRAHGPPANLGVLWSVSIEEQFYLVWPLLLSLTSRRSLAWACGVLALACVAIRTADVAAHHDGFRFWYATTSHMDSLALGTLLALAYDRLPRLSPAWWYAGVGAGLFGMVAVGRYFPLDLSPAPMTVRSALAYAAVPFLACGVVAATLVARGSVVESRPLVWFGQLTYGMYCLHPLVLALILSPSRRDALPALLVTCALAWLSKNLYERRFILLKSKFERVGTRPAT